MPSNCFPYWVSIPGPHVLTHWHIPFSWITCADSPLFKLCTTNHMLCGDWRVGLQKSHLLSIFFEIRGVRLEYCGTTCITFPCLRQPILALGKLPENVSPLGHTRLNSSDRSLSGLNNSLNGEGEGLVFSAWVWNGTLRILVVQFSDPKLFGFSGMVIFRAVTMSSCTLGKDMYWPLLRCWTFYSLRCGLLLSVLYWQWILNIYCILRMWANLSILQRGQDGGRPGYPVRGSSDLLSGPLIDSRLNTRMFPKAVCNWWPVVNP